MKVICIDDEKIILQGMVMTCKRIEKITDVKGFSSSRQGLEYITENDVDVVFLDVNMPEMNGIDLAKKIKEVRPNTQIVFTTGYSEYANDALRLSASGYLEKPVSKADIEEQLKYLETISTSAEPRIKINTFGNFEVYVDGEPVHFRRKKSKEILAYLVDKHGTGASRAEIAAVIWEDEEYDRSKQMQLNTYITDLKKDLKAVNAEDILHTLSDDIIVNVDAVYCDMYELLKGNKEAINNYHGEYMYSYSWAEFTNAVLDSKVNK